MSKPWILLDVDGVLNPEYPSARHERFWVDMTLHEVERDDVNAFADVQYCAEMGKQLLGLPGELAWCTTWEEAANEQFAPRLGLPQLPIVKAMNRVSGDHYSAKIPGIEQFISQDSRPFVWVDDDIYPQDEAYLKSQLAEPELAHFYYVNPYTGLLDEDFVKLKELLESLSE